MDMNTLRTLMRYSDWANRQITTAADGLSHEQLDRPFDMGRGSLRKTLLHILNGETVWLRRWQGQTETPWPSESESTAVAAIANRFTANAAERDAWLANIKPADVQQQIVYRDSKGSLFTASLGDMMIQMFTHSLHHRAQAINMLRRLGAAPPELDYMMWVRKPA